MPDDRTCYDDVTGNRAPEPLFLLSLEKFLAYATGQCGTGGPCSINSSSSNCCSHIRVFNTTCLLT